MKFADIAGNRAITALHPLKKIEEELSAALELYWSTADSVLKGSGIRLLKPEPDFFSLEKNFFSALFLYSYHRADIAPERRVLYAAVNQCLRGMVTGCDNILDDEYKKTLDTDLAPEGRKFRSIIDIMVSDRVIFKLLLNAVERGELTHEEAVETSARTLGALSRSGAQEAAEETGASRVLSPKDVLTHIHHYKTGMLFQSPWAVPLLLEKGLEKSVAEPIKEALYFIGMGCQIMDDMVDMASNIEQARHNYIVSLIHHGADETEKAYLERLGRFGMQGLGQDEKRDLVMRFPHALATASKQAFDYLKNGFGALYAKEHGFLTAPSIAFLAGRIQADRFLQGAA